MLIYIASWFGSLKRLQEEKRHLEKLGHLVISSWLQEKVEDPTKITTHDLTLDSNQLLAAKDFWEICEADLFIIDTIDSTDRGGREVELGYALAKQIPIILIGPKRNVFHYLLRENYLTWVEFINHLERWTK